MHRMAAVQIALHVKLRQPDAGAELAVLHEQMVAFAAKLEHPDAGALESPYGRLRSRPNPSHSSAVVNSAQFDQWRAKGTGR